MRKIKELKAEVENLRNDLFFERQKNHNLEISLVNKDIYQKSLKEELIQAQNKYVEEVQKNVKDKVQSMTGNAVAAVNVHVDDLVITEE